MNTETLTLPSGAVLEYACAGDPNGYPLLLHHGLVGSAHLPEDWQQRALAQNIRLIGVARPGYGQSTPQDMQQVNDWGAIVQPLLQHLGIGTFDVLGISAGAPYALALAHHFPERVARVWIFSGVPPVYQPDILAFYFQESRAAYRFYAQAEPEQVRHQFQSWAREQKQRWEEQFKDSETGQHMAIVWPSALAWGCAGMAREARLQIRDWGFDPATLSQPIQLWHSRADDMVPFAAVEAYTQRNLNAHLHIQPEPSHFPSSTTEQAFFQLLQNNPNL